MSDGFITRKFGSGGSNEPAPPLSISVSTTPVSFSEIRVDVTNTHGSDIIFDINETSNFSINQQTEILPSETESYNFTGLEGSTSYDYYYYALSEDGSGLVSSVTETTLETPAGATQWVYIGTSASENESIDAGRNNSSCYSTSYLEDFLTSEIPPSSKPIGHIVEVTSTRLIFGRFTIACTPRYFEAQP